ncbi:MAG: ComF family protein [Agromyces sp.]
MQFHSIDGVLIPPSRRAAFRTRGFHPMELVANAAGLRIHQHLLVAPHVRDQRGLNATQRIENMRHAFSTRPGHEPQMHGKRFLVLDDLITTGATLAAVRDAVSRAGGTVAECWALSAAERPA